MDALVTRPAEAGGRTAAALARHGWGAVIAPVIEIAGTGAAWPRGVIDAVVATSAHGFEMLAAAPEWPRPEARRLMPLFLVGTRTAAAAVAAGFGGRAWVAADAERLVDMVATALAPGRRLLYLAGHDRKPLLETALPSIGQGLEVLEVYEAQPVDRLHPAGAAAIADGSVEAALHYSQRSAALFCSLAAAAGVDPSGLLHICISDDAAAPIAAAGYQRIAVAAEPEERAMIALLTARLPQIGAYLD